MFLELGGPVTVTVKALGHQKTGPDWTSKHYMRSRSDHSLCMARGVCQLQKCRGLLSRSLLDIVVACWCHRCEQYARGYNYIEGKGEYGSGSA